MSSGLSDEALTKSEALALQRIQMRFIDEASIEVHAGHGGPGAVSFRREKYVPFGGPDGGNGGAGGSVIVVADRNKQTLLDFQFRPKWEADNGEKGDGSRKEGKSGEDLLIRLPIGTEIFNAETGALVCDLLEDGQQVILAKGGRGGKGNDFFKSPTNRAPDYAQPGEEGGAGTYRLSLKLVADVGIIGFPNAGKSTLISRISAATPKIADYPFTTLTPNLGVVQAKGGRSFVVADVPGLIPGASDGKGLGIRFLKHIERTRVIAHLIDPLQIDAEGNEIDPIRSYELILAELASFSEELANKPQLVVIGKIDAVSEPEKLQEILENFRKREIKAMAISSVSGAGLEQFIDALSALATTSA